MIGVGGSFLVNWGKPSSKAFDFFVKKQLLPTKHNITRIKKLGFEFFERAWVMGFCASMQTIGPLLKFLWKIIKKDRIFYDKPLKKVTIGTHYGVVIKIKTLSFVDWEQKSVKTL